MKRIFLGILAVTIIAVSCKNESTETSATKDSTTATTDEKPAPKLTPEQEMEKWMEYATPGEVHKMLAKSNGTWTAETTMWMHPDSPAIKSTGMAVNKMILGGRYQESMHTGNMMGMPFEGKSIVAYDNGKKVFLSTWVDNMGTGIMNMEGTWDDASKTLNSKGKMFDPASGKDLDIREVMTFVDDNNQKFEMYCTKDGKETKSMEMILKRKM